MLSSYLLILLYSLAKMRAKVWHARTHSQLFDVGQYANDMEVVYEKMWVKLEGGEEANHITELTKA